MTSTVDDFFPARYETARRQFIDAAKTHGAQVKSHRHPAQGPDGEELAIDIARFGDSEASRVVVVGSGTHGVEGRCGSGIQTALMSEGHLEDLPSGMALVFIHAINPFGFAWDRRVDQNNVDVNRNFVDHDAEHPANPDYDDLFEALNPVEFDHSTDWTSAITEYATDHGPIAAYRASVGGQYKYPEGLQFGGTRPTWSNETLRSIWNEELAGAELIANVDIHTGLGPVGIGSVMQTSDSDERATALAAEWWGGVMRSARPAESDPITCGIVGLGLDEHVTWADTVSVVLEFGTCDPLEVLGAIRADNWLEQHGDRRSQGAREINSMMRSAFFVDEASWRERVTERGVEVVTSTIGGVAGS